MSFAKLAESACLSAALATLAGCHTNDLAPENAVLDCGPRVITHMDYPEGAEGERDVISSSYDALRDLRRPGDTVGRVETDSDTARVVALVRDGRTLATAHFATDNAGGWLLSSVERCGWRERQPGG